jgi:predicted DNA binding CopG/RHH family protein
MEKTMKTQKLPKTDSIEELARFWDTHDITDFDGQLEEITESVFERKPETVMKIHLQPQEINAIKRIAKSRGVGQEALIREWVVERLHKAQA